MPDMNPYSSDPYGNQADIRGFQYGRPPEGPPWEQGSAPIVQRNAHSVAYCAKCGASDFTTDMSLWAALLMGWIGLVRYRASGGRKPVNTQRGLRANKRVQCSKCAAEYRWDGGH
jgi:hypothetical protein